MDEKQFNNYVENYIQDCYAQAQKLEAGIVEPMPKLPEGIDPILSAENLSSLFNKTKSLKPKAVQNPLKMPYAASVLSSSTSTYTNN